MNIKTKYKNTNRYPDTFGKLPLTGALPRRDSEIRGAIARITKTNAVLKLPVNKLFLFENTYQDTNQASKEKNQTKKANSVLRHVRTDFWSMMSEETLNSFMTDVLIIKTPVH